MHQADDDPCRVAAAAALRQRHEHAALRPGAWPHRTAVDGDAPQRRAGRQGQREEAALVVADGEAAFDERLAVLADDGAIARLVDRGEQDLLRRVARQGERERALRVGSIAAVAEGDDGRRQPSAQEIAEVGRIGRIEAARLVLRDLAGAQDLDRDGACLALRVGEVQQRQLDPADAGGRNSPLTITAT